MAAMQIRVLRRLGTWTRTKVALLAIGVSILAGCASDGKVKEAVRPEPSVARLDDGRKGFTITEVPQMDEASRRNFDRGVAMMRDQEYAQAIDFLQKVIDQSPGVSAPYIDIAIAYQHLGKLEEAEGHLKTALTLVPGHPVACNEYGLLYRKTGRFAEARAMYEKAIARFPDYYPAHRNLGILCDLYLNDQACALEHYEIYSEATPDDKQVKLWLADLRTRLGRN